MVNSGTAWLMDDTQEKWRKSDVISDQRFDAGFGTLEKLHRAKLR
jgi:hypothetical protein